MAMIGGGTGRVAQLLGDDQVRKAFASFTESVQRKVMARAMKAAGKPVVRAVRGSVPQDSGSMKKAIGAVVRKYPKGRHPTTVLAYIGARWGEYFWSYAGESFSEDRNRKRIPALYAHLVEEGTKPHLISPKGSKGAVGTLRIGQTHISGAVQHPGASPSRPLQKGWDATRGSAKSTLRREIATQVKKEIRRAATKAPKRT